MKRHQIEKEILEFIKEVLILRNVEVNHIEFFNRINSGNKQIVSDGKHKQTLYMHLNEEISCKIVLSEAIEDYVKDIIKKLVVNKISNMERINASEKQVEERDLLLYSAKSLASSNDLQEVLRRIMDHTFEVIDAADAGSIYIFHEDERKLVPMVTSGFEWDFIKHIRFNPGESITGQTFLNCKPVIYPDATDVSTGMETMRNTNYHYFNLAKPKKAGNSEVESKSAMCCPFIVKGHCIGVLSINNFFSDAQFTSEDLDLLEAVCNQASLAIDRAMLFQKIEGQMEHLNELNKNINTSNQEMKQNAYIHRKLTDIVLQQKGMDEIAKTAAELIGHPTIIYNYFGEILAESELPEWFDKESSLYSKSVQASFEQEKTQIITMTEIESEQMMVIISPIISDAETKGILVIPVGPVVSVSFTIIEQVSTVIILEIIKEEAIEETEERIKGEFLDDLNSEKDEAGLRDQALFLGIEEGHHYNFMAFLIENTEIEDSKKVRQFQQLIDQVITERNSKCVMFRRRRVVQVLVGWPVDTNEERLIQGSKSMIQEIKNRAESMSLTMNFSSIIGRGVEDLKNLASSYKDISKGIELVRHSMKSGDIYTYKYLSLSRLILQNSEGDLYQFVYDQLKNLIHYQYQNREDLIDTLEAYLYYYPDMQKTSDYLHLHSNTLKYRLKRIEEILGISIKEGESLLFLQFCFKIMDVTQQKRNWCEIK